MKALLFSIALVPALALASGFPAQAIWVSKTSAIEGETLVVSTVVYNNENESLRGTLVFTADGTRIGTRELEIGSGGSQIHSIEWKPKRGKHRVAATIEGTAASLSQRQTGEIEIIVAAPPPPSAEERAISTATQIGGSLAQSAGTIALSSKPIVLGTAKYIVDTIEPIRQGTVAHLESYLEKSKAPMVAGASTSRKGKSGLNISGFGSSTTPGVLSNIAQTAAAAALFALRNAFIFYPLLAFIFFALLYFAAKRIRKPGKPR